jgi:methylmalonyl-CoA/ethylmalonyl-CoA epimerase
VNIIEANSLGAKAAYDVDHLGIAVSDLDAATKFYRDVLGCPVSKPLTPDGNGVAIVFVPFANTRIELIIPTVYPPLIPHILCDHTINYFLGRQPAGRLHHVCYVVDDLLAAHERLE